jgi:hypothetical protein
MHLLVGQDAFVQPEQRHVYGHPKSHRSYPHCIHGFAIWIANASSARLEGPDQGCLRHKLQPLADGLRSRLPLKRR